MTKRSVRDSGVRWLGAVPTTWQVDRLRRACLRVTDGAHISPDLSSPDFPFVSTVDLDAERLDLEGCLRTSKATYEYLVRTGCRPRRGDVLFSKDGTVGKTAVVDTDLAFVVASSLVIITPNPARLMPRFLHYWLNDRLLQQDLQLQMSGAALRRISVEKVSRLPVALPEVSAQNAIVTFLDLKTAAIDALIAKKERLIELLQEKRQALTTQAVTKGLEVNVPIKESGVEWLGEIPTHWRVQPIKHLVSSRKGAIKTGPFGSQLTASDMSGGNIKVYNQRTVLDRDFEAGDLWISDEKFAELRVFEISPGDLLITSRGTIGRTAITPQVFSKGILHPCLIRMQLNRRRMTAEYLSLVLDHHQGVRDQLALRSNATTISVVYSDDLRQVAVPVPPLDEQGKILSEVQRVMGLFSPLVIAAQRHIDVLREYRQALISAAVTGKIDIPAEEAA